VTLLLVLALALPLPVDSSNNFDRLTLDDFLSLSREGRRDVFGKFSPSKRAEITSGYLREWRAANADRLTAEQIELLDRFQALVTPEAYSDDRPQSLEKVLEALAAEAREVFSPEDQLALRFGWTPQEKEPTGSP